MTKHTRGPWSLLGSEIRGDRGVALIKWEHARYGEPARSAVEAEDQANARLITAAPDLLQSAKDLILWFALPSKASQAQQKLEMRALLESLQAAVEKAEPTQRQQTTGRTR